MTRPQKPIN